ncbi:MAG: hypothetical protein IPN76_08630 [Saprospiraceae bacterium]|jgi:hypothetical protein|nr:hypothetical protein [Saprospiraceae bacterium]
MKTLSLKLQEPIFTEAEKMVAQLKKSRNAYINEAVAFYNRYQKRQLLAKLLAEESKLVAENSMEVLKEFEALEDEIFE